MSPSSRVSIADLDVTAAVTWHRLSCDIQQKENTLVIRVQETAAECDSTCVLQSSTWIAKSQDGSAATAPEEKFMISAASELHCSCIMHQ